MRDPGEQSARSGGAECTIRGSNVRDLGEQSARSGGAECAIRGSTLSNNKIRTSSVSGENIKLSEDIHIANISSLYFHFPT